MGSKRPARREFLKSGAALAGGFTLGAAAPALGQDTGMTPASPPMIKGDSEGQIAYGERSKYVTSVRIPHGGRPSPDNFGLTFHVATPLQDSVGVITPSSLHYFATTRGAFLPDIDPREHSSDDPRPGGPSADLHHGGLEAPPVRHPPAFHRVRGEPIVAQGEDRSGNARHDELRRMDRRAPLDAAQGVRPERQRQPGSSPKGAEEVKGASSMPIAKAMDDCIVAYGMNGEAVRPQNGFPLRLMVPGFEGIFHTKWLRRIKVVDRYYMNYNDFGHLDQDAKDRGARLPDRTEVGHHVPVRRTTAARQGLLRDQRPGLVRWRRHQAGGGVHRRRQEMEQGRVQGNAAAHGPYPFRLSVELGRKRDRDPVALHGRDRSGATVARTDRQVLEQALRSDIQRAGAGQQHSAVEDRQGRERDQWVRVGFSRSRSRC